jgi:hypothetical protein
LRAPPAGGLSVRVTLPRIEPPARPGEHRDSLTVTPA